VIDSSGHVVVVTGGNSGIGLGIARGVARAGASIAIWSRRQERNAEAVTELEGLGAAAIGVRCNVSDDEDNVADAMRARWTGSATSIAWSPTPGRPATSRSPTYRWPSGIGCCRSTWTAPSCACGRRDAQHLAARRVFARVDLARAPAVRGD